MQQSVGSKSAWFGLAAAALMMGACQGSQENKQDANAGAASNATSAGSPANDTAPANASADAGESGSLVLASDASLPEACQTLFREQEACLARGEAAARDEGDRILARGSRNMARITVTSLRATVARAPNAEGRASLCQAQLDLYRRQTAQNPSLC
jgi:hypothetical protein